ncbi:MAG: hypothetical protein RIQ53_2839 [Pseudomonadota bacterium]|jgi:hypothetical protein
MDTISLTLATDPVIGGGQANVARGMSGFEIVDASDLRQPIDITIEDTHGRRTEVKGATVGYFIRMKIMRLELRANNALTVKLLAFDANEDGGNRRAIGELVGVTRDNSAEFQARAGMSWTARLRTSKTNYAGQAYPVSTRHELVLGNRIDSRALMIVRRVDVVQLEKQDGSAPDPAWTSLKTDTPPGGWYYQPVSHPDIWGAMPIYYGTQGAGAPSILNGVAGVPSAGLTRARGILQADDTAGDVWTDSGIARVSVQLLKGETLDLSGQDGIVLRPGQVLRVRNRGMTDQHFMAQFYWTETKL